MIVGDVTEQHGVCVTGCRQTFPQQVFNYQEKQ